MDSFDNSLPGTAGTQAEQGEKGFAKIQVLLDATGGLSLSQVCVVTGLEASTIQNWVKRGWVAHPVGKRYEEVHIARILIINALKECIKLEHIAMLMTYLNGRAKDGSQAIIRESVLYNFLCETMKRSGQTGGGSRGGVENVVDDVIKDYDNPNPVARAKLRKALTLMMFACVCTDVKRRTEAMMGQIIKELNGEIAAAPIPAAKPAAQPAAKASRAAATTQAPVPVRSAKPAAAPVAPIAAPIAAPAAARPAAAPAVAPATAPAASDPAATAARTTAIPQPVAPIRLTLDDPVAPAATAAEEAAQTRKTISQALREWDISSVEKIIIDHDEEARNNVQPEPDETKKPVNRPWYIRKNK